MRQLSPRAPQHGFTLVELMITLVVTGLLLTSVSPYFGDYVTNARLREAGNTVMSAALLARSEAIKRNGNVKLARSSSTLTISDVQPSTPVTLRTVVLNDGLSASGDDVVFGGDGMLRGAANDLALDVSATGVTCSSTLRCPRVVVEVGGTVRLCGDKSNCS